MPEYLHGHHASVLASHAVRTAESSAAYLLPHLRPGQEVLDVGCGPGTITLDLAERVSPGRVIGIDRVDTALDAARGNAAARGDATTVFEVADLMALPYDDASFDVVHAHQVLQHLPDPVGALREMGRVTRPGGVVAVRDVDYESMTWHPESPGLERWLALYRRLAGLGRGEPDAARHLRAWAQAADLVDVRLSASTWLYATADDCRWWGETWAARVRESSFADAAREDGVSDDELASLAEDWLAWSAHPDAWFAMIHGELLAGPTPR